MSHSNITIFIHLVWATHKRKNTIPEQLLEPLWEYFIGIGHNKRIPVIAAGGMPNPFHWPLFAVGEVVSLGTLAHAVWGADGGR